MSSPSQFTSLKIHEMIKLVEEQPVLWNPGHCDYQNKQRRIKAWEWVAKNFFTTWDNLSVKERYLHVKEIKAKWKNVKDHFMKDKKNHSKMSDHKRKKKYTYYDVMQFLNKMSTTTTDVFQNITDQEDKGCSIKREGHLMNPKDRSTSKIEYVEISSSDSSSSSSDTESETNNASPNKCIVTEETTTKIKKSSGFRFELNTEPTSSGFVSSSPGKKSESQIKRGTEEVPIAEDTPDADDPDRMFLLSMLPLLKKLSEEKRMLARIHLMQALQKTLYPKK